MSEYTINVSEVEELQTISNVTELNKMFAKAQSTVVQGGTVVLVRRTPDGAVYKFDELTTEEDLENYKQTVLKYLS
ncbi:hypothetical protein [Segetibacter koreensis]|uniref:hypothetical protein n=1 Tax=Segetibacter koreensis TaxID=398037 RepID=UPI0003764D1D|nr:hypothetical protein [Segetibacter koreensis]